MPARLPQSIGLETPRTAPASTAVVDTRPIGAAIERAGAVLGQVLRDYLAAFDPELIEWIDANVRTPATMPLAERLLARL